MNTKIDNIFLKAYTSGKLPLIYPLLYSYNKSKIFVKYNTFDFFDTAVVEINTSCNRKCKYCPNSIYDRGSVEHGKQMDKKIFKKIINNLADLNFSGIISPQFFGEPLLDDRLTDFIKYMRKKLPKSKITVLSNGDFFTIEKYKELTEAGVDHFTITQHGNETNKNLEKLFDYIKTSPKKEKKIRIFGSQRHQKLLYNMEYQKLTSDEPLYNRGGLVKPDNVEYTPACVLMSFPLVFDYSGNAILCCNDYFGSVNFGNIKDKDIIEIWTSKKFRQIRKDLRRCNYNLDICKKCVGLMK